MHILFLLKFPFAQYNGCRNKCNITDYSIRKFHFSFYPYHYYFFEMIQHNISLFMPIILFIINVSNINELKYTVGFSIVKRIEYQPRSSIEKIYTSNNLHLIFLGLIICHEQKRTIFNNLVQQELKLVMCNVFFVYCGFLCRPSKCIAY